VVIWIAKILMVGGTLLLFIGAVGVNRLPDFYTRAHAATKPDTFGLILLMVGLSIYDGFTLSSVKMLLIVLFVALANPAATHALGKAAIRSGLLPVTVRENEGKGAER
jgi:multicomponent Na+:H+ antiporter subunit G